MTVSFRRIAYRMGLVLGLAFFAWQAWAGYRSLAQARLLPALANREELGLAALLMVARYGLQIGAWALLMRGLGVRLPIKDAMRGYALSFVPRYIPGGLWGYMSRGEWLHQDHGVPYGTSHLGSLLELAATVLAALMVVGIDALPSSLGSARVALAGVLMLLPVLLWLALRSFWGAPMVRRALGEGGLGEPLGGLGVLPWVTVVTLHLVSWLSFGVLIPLLVSTLGLQYQAPIGRSAALYAVAWLIGFLAVFVPAGIGVREFVLASALATSFAIPLGQANAISIVSRCVIVGAEIAWVVLAVLRRPTAGRKPAPG